MGFMSRDGGIMAEDITSILDGKVENKTPVSAVEKMSYTFFVYFRSEIEGIHSNFFYYRVVL